MMCSKEPLTFSAQPSTPMHIYKPMLTPMLNTVIKAFILFTVLTIMSSNNAMSAKYTKAENVERAIQRLDDASRWMVENGIKEVLTDPNYKSNVLNTLIDKFSVTPFSDPGLKSEDELARFVIKSYTIYYDINLIQRARDNGAIYEY